MVTANYIFIKLPFVQPFKYLYNEPGNLLLLILIITTIISPWVLDWLFKSWYSQKPLNKNTLNQYSDEVVKVLRCYCQKQGYGFPQLAILHVTAPIAFTYGNSPATAHIVVSQSLLEQLEVDEIAAIYAIQLAHIRCWDMAVMSLVLLVTIPISKLYQQISAWENSISLSWLRNIVSLIASFVYAVWLTLNATTFQLSRLRIYYSDHFACNITGNPNGLIRGILKIAIGIVMLKNKGIQVGN